MKFLKVFFRVLDFCYVLVFFFKFDFFFGRVLFCSSADSPCTQSILTGTQLFMRKD